MNKNLEFLTNNLPLVSIIIVNFNGKKHLEKCLESLLKINYTNYEIIIVDNNSTDGSIEFVEKNYPQIILKKLEKNYGFAHPNNLGVKLAKGELLLFLNNDTKVCPDFVIELVNTIISNKKIAICQSLLLKFNGKIDSGGDFIDVIGRPYSNHIKPDKAKPILSARGASMMVRKNVFSDLGGFDKKFFASFEDVDLGLRAWIYGYEVFVVPRSIVYHKSGSTIKKNKKEIQFHGVKNILILSLTNFGLIFTIKSIMSLFFISLIKKFFGFQIVKDPEHSSSLPSIKIISSSLIWILKNITYVKTKRNMINSKRSRTTNDLIKLNLITQI